MSPSASPSVSCPLFTLAPTLEPCPARSFSSPPIARTTVRRTRRLLRSLGMHPRNHRSAPRWARIGLVAFACTAILIQVVHARGVGSAAAASVASRAPAKAGTLSAQQLAGERVIFSYAGLTPPPALLAKIRAGEAAGVIFFKGNISSDAQIKIG